MRQLALGAAPPSRGRCPAFLPYDKPAPPHQGAPAPARRAAAPVMVHFPTLKGGLRHERLRRYFHEDMACILDVDPDVVRWTADPDPGDLRGVDASAFDLVAFTRRGPRLIRLLPSPRRGRERRGRTDRADASLPGGEGASWEVVARDDLARDPRLAAAREILHHRGREVAPELPFRLTALDDRARLRTLGEAHAALGKDSVAWEDVLCLVGRGFIDVDPRCKVGPGMTILRCDARGHLG